ncbi:MAG: helix-turn-helix domain-containing protein [Thermoleophilia bacterium]|nr:helix-turn-helix domain-containing protein [Thermoleophilia bacterium]
MAWSAEASAGLRAGKTWEILRRERDPFRALHSVRQARGLSLADVSERLEVRELYVEAIEDGRLEYLPGPAYARGIMWRLAVLLDLDPAIMVDEAHVSAFFDVDCLQASRQLVETASGGPAAARRLSLVSAGLIAAGLALIALAYALLR